MVDEAESYTLTGRFFDRVILRRPLLIIAILCVAVILLGLQARNFRLDASSETLVLEGDDDLRFAREINARYGGNSDSLVVMFQPHGDLFSDESLAVLKHLRDALRNLPGITSVRTILDVPLLESPPVSLADLKSALPTLESGNVDREMARRELSTSNLYRNLLLSEDAETTGLIVFFEPDTAYDDLRIRRDELADKERTALLTAAERKELRQVREAFRLQRKVSRSSRHEDILAIRATIDTYRPQGDVFLGGVSMIVDDLISFIKSDLKVFGVAVLVFMVVTLGVIFQRIRWVLIPVLCCLVSVICTVGLLGWLGWEVTVISSNFISLQLVITMAISIHLVVQYRELLLEHGDAPNRQLIGDTVRLKVRPCVYAVLTTIAGFGSLIFCNIRPVIMFGWMMTSGLLISLVVSFLLFPTILELLVKDRPAEPSRWHMAITGSLARFTERRGMIVLLLSGLVLAGSVVGTLRLRTENSFVNYFKHTTEIYKGMKVIDQKLGGTTPLDVIVDFDSPQHSEPATSQAPDSDEFDEFGLLDDIDQTAGRDKYWFTAEKIRRIKEIHEYLASLPSTGMVMSFATLVEVAEKLKGGPLDSLELAILYTETPQQFRDLLIRPYVSVEHNEVRFWVRVRDSDPTLRRDAFVTRIRHDLVDKLGLGPQQTRLTGLLVLYNNMLQSLYRSQILTLGITISVLAGAFAVLFRSIKIAAIAMLPNILPVLTILGVMGWSGIPLDMMTITIAAISIGIAVDNTIHYIHRFKDEFQKDRRYLNTMHRCHRSVGRAMWYTSLTITAGFSILTLSNFIPGVYFGLLSGLSMVVALLADMTLLPQLLILIKPFGRECEDA
jgi:hypothetical protein